MKTSFLLNGKSNISKMTQKLLILLSFLIVAFANTEAQAPTWVAGTPSVPSTGALSITLNYGINEVGVVYVAIYNFNNPAIYSSATVKAIAQTVPGGSLVFTGVFNVTAGNINTVLQQICGVLNVNTLHTIYIVAEGTPGGLQAAATKLFATTLPCPDVYFVNGLQQTIKCVNKGATAIFNMIPDPDPNISGILKGTTWVINWGDGTIYNYTSTADGDFPTLANRTHTYVSVTACNYVFSCSVKNPCGKTFSPQYVAVVHGRDIPTDGDGVINIVNNADGSGTINVCAGTQTIITLRDNSTWNCQNPTVPGGLTAVPNNSTRNIDWLYGQDPLGAITNTITGTVTIATLGNAPIVSGRILPSPYGTGSLSNAITIPATCQAGQYFRVYLEYWNQECNWTDPEYVSNFVDINVIAAPPAPTAPSRTICLGDVTTLTVTSPPVGTITWYSNPGLTIVLGTGTTYTPVIGAAGVTTYYVTDQSTTGLMCMSPATTVTLTTRETLVQPGVVSGPAQICSNTAGNIFSVVANPPTMPVGGATQYIWTVPAGWTITAGQGTKQITVTVDNNAGAKVVSLVDQFTTAPNCPSPSRTFNTNLNPIATINSAAAGTVCSGSLFNYTATSATPGCTFAWTRPVVAGISNGAGAGATANISETLINTTNAAVNVQYFITPTINGCTGTTFTLTVTVNPTPGVTNMVTTVCSGMGFTVTPVNGVNGIVPAGTTYTWPLPVVTGGLIGGATGNNAANISGTLTNPTNTAQTATYTVTPKTPGPANCSGPTFTVTVTVNAKPTIANKVATTCTAVAFSVTPVNGADIVPAGTQYSWPVPVVTGGMTGGAAGVNQASIFGTLNNTTATAQTATYTVTPLGGGCTGANFTVTVTVNPKASINPMAGSSCDQTVFTFTPVNGVNGTVPAGTTYSWAAPVVTGGMTGGAAGANQASISGNLTNLTNVSQTATYTVTPLSGGCTGANFTLTVTINPDAGIANKVATTCSAVGFSVTPVNGADRVPAGTTYSWPVPVVTGGMTGGAAGAGAASISGTLTNPTNTNQTATYTVTPLSGACAGTSFTVTVTVNPVPSIAAMAATTCNSTAFTVTPVNGVNGIVPAGTTYSWAAPVVTGGMTGGAAGAAQPNINGTLNNATTTTQTATYTVTPLSGACTGANFTVTVTVNPTAVINSALTKTVCSNIALAYTITSSTAGCTFTWSRAAVAGISNPANGGATALINESLINTTAADVNCTYVLTPTYNGCAGTPSNLVVTVHPQFTLAQLHDDISICNNTATNFNIAMTGGTTNYTVNYTKNGVGQAALPGYISGTNVSTGILTTGSYVYALTSVTDNFGCPAQSLGTNITVTVGAALTGATLTGSGDACFGAASTLKSVITGGAGPYTLTITGFPGSPVAGYASGSNIALTPPPLTVGAHNYTLASVTDACANTINPAANYTINISAIPDISGTVPASQTICSNATANIVVNSTVVSSTFNYTTASVPAAGYSWTVGKDPVAGSITDANADGTETITRTLQHNYNAAVTVTYTITPTGPGATACVGAPITRTVIVNPTPAITNMVNTTCSGVAFSSTPANGANGVVPAGTTYSWPAPVVTGGMTGGAAGAGAASITGTLNNPTNIAQTATYTVTPLSGACTGATFTVTVTVNPTPVIANKATSTCSAAAFTVTPVNGADIVPAGTTYSWPVPVVTGGLTGGAAGAAQPNISGTLNNPTNANQTATYTVTPVSGGCTGASFTVTVTVNPKPNIANKVTNTCSGTAFTVTPVNGADIVPAGTTYSWAAPVVTGGMTGGAAGAGQPNISGTLNNPTNVNQTATYTVTPLSGACTGSNFTVTVTVNPTPVIANKATSTCSAAAFTVTPVNGADIVPAGTTYSWPVPVVTGGMTGGAAGAAAANISGTLTNPTNVNQTATYTVTPLSGACTGATFTVTVTVNPKPGINNISTSTCSASAFTYTPANGVDGIVPAGTTYSWAAPVVTGGMTGGAAGAAQPNISGTLNNPTNVNQTATYTVTPVSGGCTGASFTVTVTVNPKPNIANKVATTCSGSAFTVTPVNGADIVPAGTTYSWAAPVVTGGMTGGAAGAGQPNISGTLNNPTNVNQTATYTVTPLSGACTGANFTVTVTVNPTPAVTNMVTSTCNSTAFTVSPVNGANGIVPAGTTYSWPLPVVTGGMTGGATGANAANISGTLNNPTTSAQTATYTVTPKSGVCTGATFTVTVTVNPTAVITSAATGTVCDNVLYNYTATSSTVGATFAWTRAAVGGISNPAGGGGTALISETLHNTTALPVNVTYVITASFGGCAGTPFNLVVTVNPTPALSSTLTPADVCSNTVFSYTPTSATPGTTFNWTRAAVAGITPVGPTSGINNPNETLRNITSGPIAVTYQYTLAANTCTNVQNVVVNINPEPVITAGQTTSACSGIALNYQVLLNNFTNPGDNVLFTWPVPVLNPINPGFTGGTARAVGSAANITDTFVNTTGAIGTATYTITPYKNGCAGTPVTVVISIGAQPVLDPGLNSFACSNAAIGLILKVAGGSVPATYYNVMTRTVDAGLVVGGGNAVIPNGTAAANYLSLDTYTNTTGVNKNVTYRVQPILAPNCFGTPVDVVITIRPQPVILPGQTKTVCSSVAVGKEILLVPANTPAGTLFNWPVPTMSDLSVQGTAGVNVVADPSGTIHINDVLHNYSAAPITATYNITPTSSFGCVGTSIPVVITVNPEPIPQPISGRDKICVTDKNVVYNVNPVAGSTFHWTVDPAVGTKTFDFNTNAILIDAAAAAGSGNITVYETNSYTCNGQPSTKAVQVYVAAAPEIIAGPATVCANSTQNYSVTNRAGSIYSWTVPGGAAIIGDPSANSITVVFANVGGSILCRETNAAGCVTDHTPKAVTVNALPTATISGSTTICVGASANLTVTFTGSGPYTFTYALNGVPQVPVATGANPYTLTVTNAGSYTIVNVTDANCTNNGSGTATVSYYPQPTGTISGTAAMCKGSSTTITITLIGTAPYNFVYTDGVTPVTVNNYASAVYTATVSPIVNTTYTMVSLTDNHSCTGVVSGSAVITVNNPPVVTPAVTNLTCNGDHTGAISLTVTGSSPFGYSWVGPNGFTANTKDISGLEAGVYTIVVTDTKGCQTTSNITVTQPAALSATLASTNLICFGAANGTITISAPAGGSGTFQYTINGGTSWQASGNFTALVPGTYNVQMRDAASPVCVKVLDAARVITGPPVLNATVASTNSDCNAGNNGTITISAPTGGFGTYQYSVNGGTTWQGSGSFTGLAPATYNVMMRDAAQPTCQVTLNPALVITEPAALNATVNKTNITCFGSADGTITIAAPVGGHGTYEYSISGGTTWQATGNFTGLTPGNYNVQIRDAAVISCYKVLNAALAVTQPAVLNATINTTAVTCNGANDGIISITGPTGGYGTYGYTINGGTSWQASGNFAGLAPGSYDVRIRDAANIACVVILNNGVNITEPAALNALVVKTDITCNGANDGVINVTNPVGGYGTYEYTINGGGAWQASGNFPGLTPATYNVQIRDKAHTACVKVLNAALVITEPAALNATLANTNITCNGAADGTITISAPTGGYGTYQYSVNGGASWQGSGNFINLAPASYNVRMRDAANPGCVKILNAALVITQPAVLSATVAKTNVTCFGAADGTITINGAAGGYGTYEYTVNGGSTWQASNSFTALIPGFYNVKIRDAANTACIVTLNGSLSVTEPGALNASLAHTNVTCNGAADGTITISGPTGGYGTYQYSINGGTSWQGSGTYNALAPGSYDVRIRDAVQTACVIILNPALVITQPAVLSGTLTSTNVNCFGASDGTITISGAAGGYGTYEYTINGGTTWVGLGTFTNLAPATYDVRIRDAAHTACVIVLNNALVITQPAVLSATVAKTNVTCFGATDGSITISAPLGGYGTYEYSVNGGGSWQASGSFTLLGPGNYNVQMRDAAHISCVKVLNNSLSITQPAVLNAVVTPTMVTCNGANDGIIAITAPTGGGGTYGYSINGGTTWQASGTFNGLAPASYDVRIRDAASITCVIILNSGLAITEPAVLSASLNSTNVTCFSANDGTITITSPTGGYGTFEYTINGGTTWQTSGSYSALAPATYNVQIRDKAHTGCVHVLNAALIITQPAALNAAVASTNVTCNGASNGTITVSGATGGYGTYQYSVNGGASWQGTGNFTGLAPATYNVQIRDAAHTGCVIVLNAALVITQPNVLSATVAKTNVNCFGAADGTITITSPLGGYGTYEYTINGGTTWQASGNFTALAPGFYNVQIRDAANTSCVVTLNGSLQITEPAVLAAVVTKTDVTCNGANDGKITISSPTGGYGTYQYTVNGGGSWQASGSFTSLAPGPYNVQIRDAAHVGCVIVLNAALTITEPAVLNATVGSTNVTCFGAANGTITISSPAGGYGTYQYTVNGGTTWQGSGTFTGLAPATYNVQMRDAANTACVKILNGALVITQPAVLNATVNKTNVTCFGAADGTITITAPTGGYGTYEYTVNGGGSWQASGNFTNLSPGSYNVQIRDAANTSCVIVLNNSLNVTQPAVLNAVVTPTMVTCKGANDGIIAITAPTGGYGTYQYSINGGTTWQASGTFNGLAPATYDVRIRDAVQTACTITLNPALVITEPSVLNATVASTNVTCFGANDGTITISAPTGGYGTYEYTINGGGAWQSSGNFTALAPASYNVQIRDKAHTGCVIVLNPALVITQPAVLSATVTSTNVTCNGANDGTITISAPLGGYGTYQYSVNGGATWQGTGNFTGLANATYIVKIRDAAYVACEKTLNPALVITQPAKLTATVASTNVTCFGANDGTITISAPAGGYGTYEYTVNGGTTWQASGNFTALTPGFYNVQIRDAANTACVVILNGSLRITEPSVLAAFVASTNVTCNGANDGTITISSPTGGYGTYEYSVNGGTTWQASGNFINLAPASYNVQMRDAAHTGCVIVLNAALVITQPAVLNATVTPTMVSCFGANDGIITISSPTGGYGVYQYSINGGTTWQGSGTFTNLAPASYNVKIRDAAHTGCVVTLNAALVITQPAVLNAAISSTNVTCFGGNDGTITISGPTGGYGTYEYTINGGGSWQASGSFTALSPGSYSVMIRDAAHTGCVIVLNGAYSITQPGLLSATVTKTDVTCNGANDGTITIASPAGGYGTYEYSINGGTSWQASGNFTGLVPGTYNVRMRDAAHIACFVILYPNLAINEPLPLVMTTSGNITLPCFGDMTGAGTFYAAGGTLPYTFTLVSNTTGGVLAAPGFNSQAFFAAGAGSITVRVTDAKNCTAVNTIVITQPANLTPGSIAANQVLCNGDNPAMLTEVTAPTGGPGAYSYQWQYGATAVGPFINIAGATSNTYTPPAGATATLYYRRMVSSGTCTPVYSNVIEILVNPKPVGILSGGETICPGQTSNLVVTLPMGTGPFTLNIQNLGVVNNYTSGNNIPVTPAATTTYTLLSVQDANSCQVTAPSGNLIGSATVTVRALPAITVQPLNKTTCEFGMVTFSVTATGSDLTYQWYVNDGSGFVPVVDGGIYFGAQTSSLMLFGATRDMNTYTYHCVVSGCSVNVTSSDVILIVNTAPEILNQPKDSTICQGAGATFSVTAQGTALVYQWQRYSGGTWLNVVNDANFSGSTTAVLTIVNAPGSFNNTMFRLKLTGTCGVPIYSSFVFLRVNVPPTVTLQPANKSICENGGPVFFTANGSGLIDSLRWQVFTGGVWSDVHDDAVYSGSTSQQLALINIPLSYNGNQYRLTLRAACTTTNSNAAILTVNANPVVDFTAVSPINACGGVPTVLNGNPTGGSGTYTQHTWTGDVGPLNNYFIQSPTFNSQIAGIYNLNYKVRDSNGCTANNNLQVNVDAPDATFATDVTMGCTPLTVNFTKDMTGIAKFWWDFGDLSPKDSVNPNPSHIFLNATPATVQYYTVTLKVRSAGGCFATFTSNITVFPQIDPSFNADKIVVCSGGSIMFNALPGANKYFWEYGDGVSGYGTNITSHTYTNFTTAPLVLTVKLTTTSFYSCVNSKTMTITVMPVPIPDFTVNPASGQEIFNPAGNIFSFINATNAGTWNWAWRFGDGGTSAAQDPSHTYTGIGTYDVVLIASNANCSDSMKHSVMVIPIPPVPNFDSIPSGCAPLTVKINNTSLNVATPGITYTWDFNDGSPVSHVKNPTYTYYNSGDFNITLMIKDAYGNTYMKSQLVHAYASPIAKFDVIPTHVFVNDEAVRFINQSQKVDLNDYYVWDFGDGDTSHVEQTYHKYMSEGTFDPTLFAYSTNGCSDKFTLTPGILVEPAGVLRFATVFTPNKTGPIDIDKLPTGGDQLDQFFFPPIREKVLDYKLQIFNRWGTLIFQTTDINHPWNGYYKGKLCKQGVYVWYVEGKYANGKPFKKVGDVTLLQ